MKRKHRLSDSDRLKMLKRSIEEERKKKAFIKLHEKEFDGRRNFFVSEHGFLNKKLIQNLYHYKKDYSEISV